MSVAAIAGTPPRRFLAARFALREMRGGLRGFYVFISCIALGVAAIAAVGSLAGSLADGLARESRVILGGDLSFSLIHREARPDELRYLSEQGALATTASLRAMARTGDGDATLVELKAIDNAYPLLGAMKLKPDIALADAVAVKEGAFGAAADPTLLARLNIKIGDRVTVGNTTLVVRAEIESEPDKLSIGIGFGPRLMVSRAALDTSALVQPGSLVRLAISRSSARTTGRRSPGNRTTGRCIPPFPRSRVGNPHPLERISSARKQRRALHAIPYNRWANRAFGRRSRRRKCGEEPFRSQARRHRDHEGARRHRRANFRDLSDASHCFGCDWRIDRRGDRRGGTRTSSADCSARIIPLPIEPALQPDQLILSFIYGLLNRARLRAVAARTRA